MEIKFIVTKEERKVLVRAIGEIAGFTPVYKGAPSFAFAINNYIIDRHGTLTYDERTDIEDVRHLLSELTAQGFVHENTADLMVHADINLETAQTHENTDENIHAMQEGFATQVGSFSSSGTPGDDVVDSSTVGALISGVDDASSVCVSINENAVADSAYLDAVEVSLEGFTPTALDNLDRLISGKSALIMKAIGVDALPPIVRTDTSLRFPWFSASATDIEMDAYSRFVHALCELAKKQKRVIMREKSQDNNASGDSEKFTFRCFLLRLGFIGKEYAPARKVLLSKLSGSSSFKNGDHKSRSVSSGVAVVGIGADYSEENTGTGVSVAVQDDV